MPLAGGTQNIQLLEQIVSDQRGLLMQVFNTTDVTTIPQVWTLCEFCSIHVSTVCLLKSCWATDKEVEGYYDDGMQVPDDVILLWSDDKLVLQLNSCVLSAVADLWR